MHVPKLNGTARKIALYGDELTAFSNVILKIRYILIGIGLIGDGAVTHACVVYLDL